MTLLDHFALLDHFTVDGHTVRAGLVFPESDPVYAGHFPGRPVVPGACVLELAKELSEKALGHAMLLTGVGNIKFPAALLPSEHIVTFDISLSAHEGGWKADATVKTGERLHVSMRDIQLAKANP
jgi:3-hydroxyacyl-[acyl-carrier-protein] dehydratase